jgi:hypothetical protein
MSSSIRNPVPVQSKGRWQFSLRNLILFVVVAAIAAGVVGRLLRQRSVVRELRQLGVDVDYDSGIQTSGEGEGGQVQSYPLFAKDWVLENDLIYDVHSVRISANNPDRSPRWWSGSESRQALSLTAELPDLRSLMLNRCVVRQTDFEHLACSQLTDLIMYDVDVRDEDLRPLRRARNLILIQMYRVPVGDEGFSFLRGHRNIEVLDLANVRITDKSLSILPTMPRLRDLSLSSDCVTDDGLASLQRCRALRVLNLGCKNVTDRGAAVLAELANLDELSVYSTNITRRGAEVLASSPPLKLTQVTVTLTTPAPSSTVQPIRP